MFGKLVENHAIAPIVVGRLSIFDSASIKSPRDGIGDFANPMVEIVGTDVDDFTMNGIGRRIQCAHDRPANVAAMHQGSPRAAVTAHPNATAGPCQTAKVVHNQIKSLSWRCSKSGRIAKAHRRKFWPRQGNDVPFTKRFA